nr:MAG TPA: hypothetical protein [Caudoviricetes sp.]
MLGHLAHPRRNPRRCRRRSAHRLQRRARLHHSLPQGGKRQRLDYCRHRLRRDLAGVGGRVHRCLLIPGFWAVEPISRTT